MSDNGSSIIVDNENTLDQWLTKSSDFLILFDVHLNWTGRCESLIPQLDTLHRTIDSSESRWKVLSIEVPRLTDKLLSMVELSLSCSHSSITDDDSKKQKGDDENNKDLLGTLMKKTSCSPLFLVVKDCKVVCIVEGANYPALSKAIYEHMPVISDEEEEVMNEEE